MRRKSLDEGLFYVFGYRMSPIFPLNLNNFPPASNLSQTYVTLAIKDKKWELFFMLLHIHFAQPDLRPELT